MRRILRVIILVALAYPALVALLGLAYLLVPPVSTLMLGTNGRSASTHATR